MREKILSDLVQVMKSREKEVLSVLRLVKGSMQLEEIKLKRELNDEEVISIINKQIKTRKDSIVEFEKGNRQDLIDQANKEIKILEKYMPAQLTKEEINKIIDETFDKINPNGISDLGKLMGYISSIIKGKADLGVVNKIIRERLNK